MRLRAHEILRLPHREVIREDALRGAVMNGVSTDSRSVVPGNLFVALRGEHFDGHDFVDGVAAQGAVAAIVESTGRSRIASALPLLVVDDTTTALGTLAGLYRRKFDLPVLAIAGSNGKTTTKEMIAAVLREKYTVLSTEGNLNNHIGVPLTLFRLEKAHEVAVLELGTNHPGELERLLAIAQPTQGLLTNIGREHLEFFVDLDGVEREEGTLFTWLGGVKGARLFVNGDDERVTRRVPRRVAKTVRYGTRGRPAVRGTFVEREGQSGTTVRVSGPGTRRPFRLELPLPGRHNAVDALAAIAVGLSFRVPPQAITKALEGFQPASKRTEVHTIGGVTVLNDTYNANPDSMEAALTMLAEMRGDGKCIAVLGDMRELGDRGPEEHRRIGEKARALGIEYLLTFGELAKEFAEGFGRDGALRYDQKNALAEYLAELVSPGDVVLIKGSRGMRLEDVVTFLASQLGSSVPRYGHQ